MHVESNTDPVIAKALFGKGKRIFTAREKKLQEIDNKLENLN